MEGAPLVANQIDLFMHFLGASRDGLVARPVEMDKLSSSVGHICNYGCLVPFIYMESMSTFHIYN